MKPHLDEINRLQRERDELRVAARALLDALDRADSQFPEAADLDALLPPPPTPPASNEVLARVPGRFDWCPVCSLNAAAGDESGDACLLCGETLDTPRRK